MTRRDRIVIIAHGLLVVIMLVLCVGYFVGGLLHPEASTLAYIASAGSVFVAAYVIKSLGNYLRGRNQ